MTLYGYQWEDGKYVGDDNAHQVADVGCIAECEMIKPTNAIVSDANILGLSVCLCCVFYQLNQLRLKQKEAAAL